MDITKDFGQLVYEDGEEIFEPAPYSDEINSLVDAIKGTIKIEIKNRIISLSKEVEELSDIKKNWKKLLQEQQELRHSVEFEKRDIVNKVRQERLADLFGNRTMTIWREGSETRKREKCSLCDDNRILHATLPNGKIISQPCDCSGFYYFYTPKQYIISEMMLHHLDNNLSVWYKPYQNTNDDGYTNFDIVSNNQILGDVQSFDKLPRNKTFYFDTEEHAQKYCDWLNNTVKEK